MHFHVHEQATYVAAGEFIFFCEGEPEQKLSAGDMFWVPSNKKHTIQLLSKKVRLIDSFNPIREDFLGWQRIIYNLSDKKVVCGKEQLLDNILTRYSTQLLV